MSPGKAQTLWARKEHENPPSTGTGNEGLELCWFWRLHFSPLRAPIWPVKLLALTHCTSRACLLFACRGRKKHILGSGERLAWWQNQVQRGKHSKQRKLSQIIALSPNPVPIKEPYYAHPTPISPKTESRVQSWISFGVLLESTVCCACRE